MFKNKVDEYKMSASGGADTISTVATRFVSFVFSKSKYYISEIEAYGERTAPNVLENKIPSAFAVTAQGSVRYKWGNDKNRKYR